MSSPSTSDEVMTASGGDSLKATGGTLNELVLSLDTAEQTQASELQGSTLSFLGGDGVAIQLGPSWENGIEARRQ